MLLDALSLSGINYTAVWATEHWEYCTWECVSRWLMCMNFNVIVIMCTYEALSSHTTLLWCVVGPVGKAGLLCVSERRGNNESRDHVKNPPCLVQPRGCRSATPNLISLPLSDRAVACGGCRPCITLNIHTLTYAVRDPLGKKHKRQRPAFQKCSKLAWVCAHKQQHNPFWAGESCADALQSAGKISP